jgi:hypothetical protein
LTNEVSVVSPSPLIDHDDPIKRGRSVHALAYTLMSLRFVAMKPDKKGCRSASPADSIIAAIVAERKFGVSV